MIPLRDANPTRRRPVVTISLVAICIAVFAYELTIQAGQGADGLGRLFRDHGLVPASVVGQLRGTQGGGLGGALLALVTSQFLHADVFHIGFNLLFLWIFGNNVEDRFGRLGFLVFYLAGGILAGATQIAIGPTSEVPVIGASGAIAAVLGAYVVLYPAARVLTLVYLGVFFQLIRVPAIVILGLWFALQLVDGVVSLGKPEAAGGVALFAHIGGFIGGVVVAVLVRAVTSAGGPRAARSTDRAGVG